jgi:hypothetical protein
MIHTILNATMELRIPNPATLAGKQVPAGTQTVVADLASLCLLAISGGYRRKDTIVHATAR